MQKVHFNLLLSPNFPQPTRHSHFFLLCEAKCLIMIILSFIAFISHLQAAGHFPSLSLTYVCLGTHEVWMSYPVSVALFTWCRSRNLPRGNFKFYPQLLRVLYMFQDTYSACEEQFVFKRTGCPSLLFGWMTFEL